MATSTLPTPSFDQELALKGYNVKAYLFIPFDEQKVKTRHPVAHGLGKNLKEIVVMEDVVSFNFDTEVYDIAFMA
jgi:hypothetical protein